jgi:cytosine deaminase
MSDLLITDVRPWGAPSADVLVSDGKVTAITPAGQSRPQSPEVGDQVEGRNRLLLPAFTDAHLHLDSSRLGLPFRPHSGGTTLEEQVANDRRHWREAEWSVAKRATHALGLGIAYGMTRARSYAQIDTDCRLERFEGVLAARDAHRGRAEVDVIAFPQAGVIRDPGTADLLATALTMGADAVGGIDPCALDRDPRGQLDLVFELADRHSVDVDIHLHERGALGLFTLTMITDRTRALSMAGHVTVSHAFCLADADVREQTAALDTLADLDIALTTAAPPQHPLPLRELVDHGIRVGLGQDGQRDYWSPYGNGDMLDRVWQLSWSNGFVHDTDVERCLGVASLGGRSLLRSATAERPQLADPPRLSVGDEADLVLVDAETPTAAVMDRPPHRTVIHRGRVVSDGGKASTTEPLQP